MDTHSKHPGGRPVKYTDEVLSQLAQNLREWVKQNSKTNTLALLKKWCFENDFHPKYFKRYASKHPEFKEAYEWAKAWQEYMVSYGALTQTLNARFAQFFLGCNHGWRTKEPTEDKLGQLRNEFGKYLDLIKGAEGEEESEEVWEE
jgi:hypothetical protein